MNKAIEAATAHFRAQISGEMAHITVPEWGNTDIWFKSAITLREQSKLIELSSAGKQVEALVETLIVKARNQDGTKMFTFADKNTFMNEVDPTVVIRVVTEMNGLANEPDGAQAEKN